MAAKKMKKAKPAAAKKPKKVTKKPAKRSPKKPMKSTKNSGKAAVKMVPAKKAEAALDDPQTREYLTLGASARKLAITPTVIPEC